MNKKTQFKKIKKIRKILSKEDIAVASSIEYEDQDFLAIQDIIENTIVSSGLSSENHTIVLEGSMVDVGKLSELKAELVKLEDKIGYAIPFIFDYQTGRISVSPIINTSSVSDKQKMLKITTEFYDIIKKLGGVYFSTESEGRWASAILYNKMNSDIIDLYENIKKIFDPYVILNEGVKQPAELRTLIEQLPR
jgi:FAD/FMN-containing dehydrogenase